MDYFSTLIEKTKTLVMGAENDWQVQLSSAKDNLQLKKIIIDRQLDNLHSAYNNNNYDIDKQLELKKNFQLSLDDFIEATKTSDTRINEKESYRLNRLGKIKNTINAEQKFSLNTIKAYKNNIQAVYDTTITRVDNRLNQEPLENSMLLLKASESKNNGLPIWGTFYVDQITYINQSDFDVDAKTLLFELLWFNDYQKSQKNEHNHKEAFKAELEKLQKPLPLFIQNYCNKKPTPIFAQSLIKFKKNFCEINPDNNNDVQNFVNLTVNKILITEQNEKKEEENWKVNKSKAHNNTKIIKKTLKIKNKNHELISLKDLQSYLNALNQEFLLTNQDSKQKEKLRQRINKTTNTIDDKIKRLELKDPQVSIDNCENYSKILENKLSLIETRIKQINEVIQQNKDLTKEESLKKELLLKQQTQLKKDIIFNNILKEHTKNYNDKIINKKIQQLELKNQRDKQRDLVQNYPTKDNLVVYRNLLVIHLDSRLSEIKKQEIKQCLEDIDEQLKKIEILEGLQKELEAANTLFDLYSHAKSIIQSHMPQLIPSSFNNPFNKKIIENLTRCLQKINTINIEKNGEGFYELIKLNDALASLFETPNNNNNNNNISLNDDVILKFKGEYLALTQNLITSLLDEKLDDDKDTLESLQKNIAQVTGQEKPETITLEIKIGKEIEELQAKIKKNENEKETKEKEKKDLKIEIKKIEKESEQLKIEVQQTNIVVEIGKEETEKIDKEIKDLKIELDKRTQQNLEQEKIDKENMDALTALCERYNFKDLSPAQVIHYDPKTVENDLATLKDNTYILGLEKEYKKIVDGLTNIQKELQKASDTISSYKELFSERKYVFKDFNGICNNINILIQYLPTKKLTDVNNPLYQDLIETLLKYINLIEHCSDLRSATTVKRLEELIEKLDKYKDINSENINKAIETVKKNIKRLKEEEEIIQFYYKLTENELLFHSPNTLRENHNSLFTFYNTTKNVPFFLGTIEKNIYTKIDNMTYYCRTLSLANNSYQHLNQIKIITKDLDNLKNIEDLSTKIINYKKNSLYQEIINTINFCLTQINNDQMFPKLNEELISKLNSLNQKFKTYAEFDKENFNPMMQQLEEIANKKPLTQPDQVSLIQPSPTAIVASQNNGQQPNNQAISTVQQNNTNTNANSDSLAQIITKNNNSNTIEKKDTSNPSNTLKPQQQQSIFSTFWTAIKYAFSWLAFWNWLS